MALKIYWSRKADENFDEIVQYLSHEWGENVAKSFVPVFVHEKVNVVAIIPIKDSK